MNMVFIYGPPASGKLTVANELARLTNYPVFHNHLTRDLVQDIYKDNLAEHYDLVDMLRLDVMKYCAEHNTDIIFTWVYEGPEDDESLRQKIDVVEQYGGNVLFVELVAPKEVLLSRAGNESRRKHKKLVDTNKLARVLESVPFGSIPHSDILIIDSSSKTPQEAALAVRDHYRLT